MICIVLVIANLPVNATLMDGLSGDTSRGVDVQITHRVGVRVGDPRHLALARAHV